MNDWWADFGIAFASSAAIAVAAITHSYWLGLLTWVLVYLLIAVVAGIVDRVREVRRRWP